MPALPAGYPVGKAGFCIFVFSSTADVGCALRTASKHRQMFNGHLPVWLSRTPRCLLPVTHPGLSSIRPTGPNYLHTRLHAHIDEMSNTANRKLAPRAHASPDSNECNRHAAQNPSRRESGVPRNAVATILLPAVCFVTQINPAHRNPRRMSWRHDA